MKTLQFRDDEAFYRELLAALRAREAVRIVTPFKNYDEVPRRLREVFELAEHKRGPWINAATGVFVAGTAASAATGVGMNYKPLVVLGATAAGAGVGAGVGAMAGGVGAGPGALVGAGVGLAAGTVAAAFMDGKHSAQVEIDKSGRLIIKVTPQSR